MAIKLMEISGQDAGGAVVTLFADTKDEVPETGAATVVPGLGMPISTGSILYTAKVELACLKSDNTWQWKE